jgi:hypothetical protein
MLNDLIPENIDYQGKAEPEEQDLAKQETQSDSADKKSSYNDEDKLEERLMNIIEKYSNLENEKEAEEDPFAEIKLKKLKKTKLIEKEKKINKILSLNTFFEYEAELGSDNEEHDDVVKKEKNDDDNYLDEENDEDLKDLIADENEIGEDEENIQEKYFEEMLEQDKENLKRVIKGPPARLKRDRNDIKLDKEYLPLNMRMKKQRSDDGVLYSFSNDVIFRKLESIQQRIGENEEEGDENEEMKEMYQSYENSIIKKIAEKSNDYAKQLDERIKEHDEIMKNVIMVDENKNKRADNKFYIEGTIKMNNNTSACSQINVQRYAHRFNKNSVLYAMKNDKYYKHDDCQREITLSNSTIDSVKEDKNVTNFSTNLNLKNSMNGKAMNLSSLFKSGKGSVNINERKRMEELNSSGKKRETSLKRILN